MRAPNREEREFFKELFNCDNKEIRILLLERRGLEQEFYPHLVYERDEEKLQKLWISFDMKTNKIDKRLKELGYKKCRKK